MISKLRTVTNVTDLSYYNLNNARDWKRIIYHCSATPDGEQQRDASSMQRYHINVKGWSDIGYHFVVEKYKGSWVIVEARPLSQSGAHVKGRMNYLAIGICFAGKFDTRYPETGQIILARKLTLTLRARFKIPVPKLGTHSEYSTKTCPGKLLPAPVMRLIFA